MWVESIVCNISVVFLGHSVALHQYKCKMYVKRVSTTDGMGKSSDAEDLTAEVMLDGSSFDRSCKDHV